MAAVVVPARGRDAPAAESRRAAAQTAMPDLQAGQYLDQGVMNDAVGPQPVGCQRMALGNRRL